MGIRDSIRLLCFLQASVDDDARCVRSVDLGRAHIRVEDWIEIRVDESIQVRIRPEVAVMGFFMCSNSYDVERPMVEKKVVCRHRMQALEDMNLFGKDRNLSILRTSLVKLTRKEYRVMMGVWQIVLDLVAEKANFPG